MEARSLADLNHLAANPPQYPEKPADERQQSLTLYISRVPGTRDVILSTLKPQERNVTGEDVANCLYYIHLESPTHGLTQPEPVRDGKWRSSEESGSSPLTIPRKPVADQARALTPDKTANGALLPPLQPTDSADPNPPTIESSNIVNGLSRDPCPPLENPDTAVPSIQDQHEVHASSTTKAGNNRTATGLHTGMPARKPLGPRPMSASHAPDSKPTIAAAASSSGPSTQLLDDLVAADNADGFNERQNEQWPDSPLKTPSPQSGHVGSSHAQPSSARPWTAADHAPSRSPSPRKPSNPSTNGNGTPFTLIIVRRDPSSGNQWNVGRVSSRQLDAVENGDEQESQLGPSSVSPSSSYIHPYPSISIVLENSGYAKFRIMARKKNGLAEGGSNGDNCKTSRGEFGIFFRELLMEYSQSFTKKLQKTIQRLEQTSLNKLNRHRSDSVGSVASNVSDTSDGADVIATDGPPPPGMKPRGYVFTSPWGGKCDFRTGQAGRSLICRHKPQDVGNSINYNPLVADHNTASIFAHIGKMVSDLRFNLPSSEIFAERGEQWKGNFGKFLKQGGGAQGNYYDGDEKGDGTISPFKLHLGTERAGGGSRGRKAKLGKLIVHDEGLKMLDLVVAANMGIWWGAWERNF